MAVLSKEDFNSRLQTMFAEDTSDDAIAFIEDMTDTYNSLESNTNNSEWETKYNELDQTWRKRYRDRFFNSEANEPNNGEDNDNNDGDNSPEDFDDLFSESGE